MPDVVMKVCGFGNGEHCPITGMYLQEFDHEAHDGLGEGLFTEDIGSAMHFKNNGDAFAFWNRQSKVKPLRADGKPNKPLTCTSMVFMQVDDA